MAEIPQKLSQKIYRSCNDLAEALASSNSNSNFIEEEHSANRTESRPNEERHSANRTANRAEGNAERHACANEENNEEKPARKRIVFTNGCFDILHRGHVTYLSEARNLGELLIVGLNSDSSVTRLKGPRRPLNPWEDRAILLSALEAVDFVVFFDEDTPEAAIEILRPDIHCKGGDYRPEELPERRTVEERGGRVVILPLVDSYSTTGICQRIEAGRH